MRRVDCISISEKEERSQGATAPHPTTSFLAGTFETRTLRPRLPDYSCGAVGPKHSWRGVLNRVQDAACGLLT